MTDRKKFVEPELVKCEESLDKVTLQMMHHYDECCNFTNGNKH